MSKKFIKNKEDFMCAKCGHSVIGNGYTNHCPICLWSRHVDVSPGDRLAEATCGGLMEPFRISGDTSHGYVVTHRCTACGHQKPNKLSASDDMDVVVSLVRKINANLK